MNHKTFRILFLLAAALMGFIAGYIYDMHYAEAFSRHTTQPLPGPSHDPGPPPMPISNPSTLVPQPSPPSFVYMGPGTGQINRVFAQQALTLMNREVSNGCLKKKVEGHAFVSLNSVFTPSVKTSVDAYAAYVAHAPYGLDLQWYSKRLSKVIGYTYNFKNDDWNKESETRIWSNTRKMSTPDVYASHLAHELSHQSRAGGFVHYTVFTGSFPYDVGDLMAECIRQDF